MNITRENYEIFFIDYLDGKLSQEAEAHLHRFLEENPDLKEELSLIRDYQLQPDEHIQYPAKEKLKQNEVEKAGNINEKTYDEYFVAYLEGDLSHKEEKNVRRFLDMNPSLIKEFERYQHTRLEPDLTINYKDKESLKKPLVRPLRKKLYYAFSAAAVIIVLMGFWFALKNVPQAPDHNQLSENQTRSIKPLNEMAQLKAEQVYIDERVYDIKESLVTRNRMNPDLAISYGEDDLQLETIYEIPESELASLVDDVAPAVLDYKVEYAPLFRDMQVARQVSEKEGRNQRHWSKHLWAAVKNVFTTKEIPVINEPARINLWTIADLGVTGFSKMTNSNLKLETRRNEEGRVISYRLLSDDVVIARSRKDKEKEN